MSFDPKEFIELASSLNGDKLLTNISEEAIKRTIIGRAYYGAFLYARNKVGYQIDKTGNVHYKVAQLFTDKIDMTEQKIGKYLGELHDFRKTADYKQNWNRKGYPDIDEAVEKAIRRSRQIVGILNQMD